MLQEFTHRAHAFVGSLRQGSEADRVCTCSEMRQLRCPRNVIPGDILPNAVTRGSVVFQRRDTRACRMQRVQLHATDINPRGLKQGDSRPAKFVLSNSAGYHGTCTQNPCDVREVGGCATQVHSGRQHIPQNLSEPDH
jgi:hypothetical protein